VLHVLRGDVRPDAEPAAAGTSDGERSLGDALIEAGDRGRAHATECAADRAGRAAADAVVELPRSSTSGPGVPTGGGGGGGRRRSAKVPAADEE